MQADTANGPITVFSLQGTEVGHGWGEVKLTRGEPGLRPSTAGTVRRMTWLGALPAPADSQILRIAFYGGQSFHGLFEPGWPDRARDYAAFTPTNRPGG